MKGRKTRKYHNLAVWAVVAEVTVVMALTMLIAVYAAGKMMLINLLISDICMSVLALFMYLNAGLFERSIKRFFRRVVSVFRRNKKHQKRNLVIVDFKDYMVTERRVI